MCVEGEMIVCVCVCVETGGVWRDRGVCVCVCGDGGVCVQRDWGVVVEGEEGGGRMWSEKCVCVGGS